MANVGMPLQFSRMYNGPLDEKDVFETYEAALEYARSPIGYPGHVIAIKATEFRRNVYVINDDKSLSMISTTRADIDVTINPSDWSTQRPYNFRHEIPDLYEDDNVVVTMAAESDRAQYDAVINAKISNITQENGAVTFYCEEEKPEVSITLRLVVGGLISAVEVPNSATVDTKLHTIRINVADWSENNTYRVIVPDLTISDNAVVSVAANQSAEQINTIADADINVIEQGNGYVIIKATNQIPYLDFDISVAFGPNIVVVPDDTVVKSATYSRTITLVAGKWSPDLINDETRYVQRFELEGMTETVNGGVIIPSSLTNEELESIAAAELTLVQGDGFIKIVCNGVTPSKDITLGITYGNHINILETAPMIVDRNALAISASYTLLKESWVHDVESNKYLYTINDVKDLDKYSNGYIGLANNIAKDAEAAAISLELEINSVVDNNIIITANNKPNIDIPVTISYGGNIIVTGTKYFGVRDIADANDIVYHGTDNHSIYTVGNALDNLYDGVPVTADPSKTLTAYHNNIPNGIIMKDAFEDKYYIIRMKNGIMTSEELDSELLPYFNGVSDVYYPLDLYKNKDKLGDRTYSYWYTTTEIGKIRLSEGKLVSVDMGLNTGRTVVGTMPELLEDIRDVGAYTVFDVGSGLYLWVAHGDIYFFYGLYENPSTFDSYKMHGTIAERPISAPTGGIFFNTTTNEYTIYNGTKWVPMNSAV